MRTETTTRALYSFDELSDKARDRAVEQLQYIDVEYEWWEGVYEDAASIGLKITSFTVGRGSDIAGKLMMSGLDVCAAILANHGPDCETTLLAGAYRKAWEALPEDEDGDKIGDEELTQEFRRDLLGDYLGALRGEYEYRTSRESIIETIECNGYEFTPDGDLA